MRACAIFSAFLVSACAPEPVPVVSYRGIEAAPVRDWCAAGVAPEINPSGWATCSVVTRADAERLAAQRKVVEGAKCIDATC